MATARVGPEARPNIRIEIHNDIAEQPMEVDGADVEPEDGEIPDNDLETSLESYNSSVINTNRAWTNVDGGFTTGVDIFDKHKLTERAKRFGLDPTEVTNFTDDQLRELHDSLGITVDNEKDVRFEAIHVRGTSEMSTTNLFEYFGKYGPAFIEWIDDESCNVVWNDKVSATRALHFVSRPIAGMPVEGACNPFTREVVMETAADDSNKKGDESEVGQSILLKNLDREVEMERNDEATSPTAAANTGEDKENDKGTLHISDITIPVPPGYWRLGTPHLKAKFLLMRFAFVTDKKPLRAERFSEYYKKHGNPNFGGMRGIISESRRRKMRGIFDHNKDMAAEKQPDDGAKNPWGHLATTWDSDADFRERRDDPPIVVEESPPRAEAREVMIPQRRAKPDVLKRLGVKRAVEEVKKMVGEEVEEGEEEEGGEEEDVVKTKKSKVPRMRMYADEEEENIKRKKQMQLLKGITEEAQRKTERVAPDRRDLRAVIDATSRRNTGITVPIRSWMDVVDKPIYVPPKKSIRQVIETPSRLNEFRMRSDVIASHERHHHHHHHHLKATDVRVTLEKRRDRASVRERRKDGSSDRSGRHRRLYSDRERHGRRPRSGEREDRGEDVGSKPKSKVAVVIKQTKRPTVASTVWSRINVPKDRLKMRSERNRQRSDSGSSSEESSSTSSSSSESSSSESSSESEVVAVPAIKKQSATARPGFRGSSRPRIGTDSGSKSPLRIEITNDHFKEE